MKFGLIGYPIGHSLSPALFRAAYADQPFADAYDLIEKTDFAEAMHIFRKDYDAVNITAPFKETAFAEADESDTATSQIGATNLLLRKDGRIRAFNTDFWAVLQLLRRHMPPIGRPDVLVIGCGGAGKAAAYAASDLRLRTVIANRSLERARTFCDRLGGMEAIALEEIPAVAHNFGFVIYTLPVAIKEAQALHGLDARIIEANYRDPVLQGSVRRYIGGREWLAAQAMFGFKLMTGIQPDTDRMNAVINITT